MKKTTARGAVWILALAVLAGALSGCSAKWPEASKNGVRGRTSGRDGQITDQKLNRCEYTVSGDMEGSYYRLILERYDEDHALYTEQKASSHVQDIEENVYLVDAGILEDLQTVFNENGMKLWDNKRDFSDEVIYDGASYSYYFKFDVDSVGFSSQCYDKPYNSGIAQLHQVLASYEENLKKIEKPKRVTFEKFEGEYSFRSGFGGWTTDVTIYGDGSFSGAFLDSDMGVTGEGYPNGTVYLCRFSGNFSELEKKDDYTYTCFLEEITQEKTKGAEEIDREEGIRYIYSYPYGFDGGKEFEFCLPGKSVADCSPEFLSWMSAVRYHEPYPETLLNRAIHNVSNGYGFEEVIEESQKAAADYPVSLPLSGQDLSGSYVNKKLDITLTIECGNGDGICGAIFWDIPEKYCVGNRTEACASSDNGFDAKTEMYGGEYRTSYKIIVTDNTKNEVVIHLYDDQGRDCGEYVMTDSFGQFDAIEEDTDTLRLWVNTESAPTVYFGSYAWRVIGMDDIGVAPLGGNMTLISEKVISTSQFESFGVSNAYAHSTLQTNTDAVADWFSEEEKYAVTKRTLSSGAYTIDAPNETDCVAGSEVAEVSLWPLSTKEANAVNEVLRAADFENFSSDEAIYWLRSPGFHEDVAAVVYGEGSVMPDGHRVDSKLGVRPAFYLDLSHVFFMSAAEVGKPASLKPIGASWDCTWKLTLKDHTTGFEAALPSAGTAGESVSVNVQAIPAGGTSYNQISAMLIDSYGILMAYGKIGEASTGEKTFTIPETLPGGIYTLKVFPEQVNGACETDYAGNVIENTDFSIAGAKD